MELHTTKAKHRASLSRISSLLRPSTFDMDEKGRHCNRNGGKPSTTVDMSSIVSSETLVESVTSKSSLLSNSDNRCASLNQIPPHLLYRITAYLDIVSKICLQSTNHYFRTTTHADRADLNTCARYLLAHHFRQNGNSTTELMATRFLCKKSRVLNDDRVQYLDEPRYEISKWIARALDRLPWVRRKITLDLDKRHLYRISNRRRPKYSAELMVQLGLDPLDAGSLEYALLGLGLLTRAWLAFQVQRCTHCGKYVAEGDTRLRGCLRCKCDFCFRVPENILRRCGPGIWSHPRPDRQIFVDRAAKQTYLMEGSGERRIFVPVYNPFSLEDRLRLLDKRFLHVYDEHGVDNGRGPRVWKELRYCEALDRQSKKCQVASITMSQKI